MPGRKRLRAGIVPTLLFRRPIPSSYALLSFAVGFAVGFSVAESISASSRAMK
jgi:hypothetical protein